MPLLTNLSHYSSTASYEAPPPCFGIDVSTIEGEHGKGNMTAEPTVLDLRANMQPHLASELVFDANLYIMPSINAPSSAAAIVSEAARQPQQMLHIASPEPVGLFSRTEIKENYPENTPPVRADPQKYMQNTVTPAHESEHEEVGLGRCVISVAFGPTLNSTKAVAPERVERFKQQTTTSKALPYVVTYHWSRTEGEAPLEEPLADAAVNIPGDLYLHIGGKDLQFWVCQADSNSKHYWKQANLYSSTTPPTPWPGKEKPLFLSYNRPMKRPTWVLRSSITTMAGRR